MGRFKTSKNKSKRTNKRNNSEAKKQQKVGLSNFSSAEVVDIILNEDHPDYSLEKKIGVGSVKARRIKEEFGVQSSSLSYYSPFFGTGIWIPPLKGEIVQLVSALGWGAQKDHKSEEMYYLPPINIWQDPNHNQLPGASYQLGVMDGTSEAEICNPSGQYSSNPGTAKAIEPDPPVPLGFIFEEKEVQRLFPYEGDLILEGRGAHSIRLGSTVKKAEYKNWWSSTGNNGDPITIISDDHSKTSGGDYKLEDVNADGGIVVLACTQKIPINIISTDGDNIRWNSYDNTPTAKKQDASELNYTKVIKEKEKKGDPEEETPVDDRKQVTEKEETKKQEEEPPCPEGQQKNTAGECEDIVEDNQPVVIEDIIFGDAVAHGLSGRPGTGKIKDHPDTPFGTSKYLASPLTVHRFLTEYPEDQISGKPVVLSCGLIAHSVDFKPGIVHLVRTPNGRVTDYQAFSTGVNSSYYRRTSLTSQFVKKNVLNSEGDFYTWHDWGRTTTERDQMFKLMEGSDSNLPGNFHYELTVPKSKLNMSQTVDQMRNCFTYATNDIASIDKQLSYLTSINCTVKLCGIGNAKGTRLGLDFNDLLQEISDKYDNTTFIGGYEMDKGKKSDFYPADPDDYKKRVNDGTAAPRPIPNPVPDPVGNITTYKGFNIEEKEYSKDQVRSTVNSEPASYYFRVTEEPSFKLTVPPGYDGESDCIKEALGEREYYFNEAGSGGLSARFLQGSDVSPQSQRPKMAGTNENYIELIKRRIDFVEEDHFDTFCF